MSQAPHYNNMCLYLEDAAVSETPWNLWERSTDGEAWDSCGGNPSWNSRLMYRRIKKTHKVNGFDVAAPMSRKPRAGFRYFIVSSNGVVNRVFIRDHTDKALFKIGNFYKTEEDAQENFDAIYHLGKFAEVEDARAD